MLTEDKKDIWCGFLIPGGFLHHFLASSDSLAEGATGMVPRVASLIMWSLDFIFYLINSSLSLLSLSEIQILKLSFSKLFIHYFYLSYPACIYLSSTWWQLHGNKLTETGRSWRKYTHTLTSILFQRGEDKPGSSQGYLVMLGIPNADDMGAGRKDSSNWDWLHAKLCSHFLYSFNSYKRILWIISQHLLPGDRINIDKEGFMLLFAFLFFST